MENSTRGPRNRFAIGYAIVTGLQWQDLRHNFKVEQRAWIGYNTMAITNLKAGEPLRCDIKLLNSGKTFALDVSIARRSAD